MTDPGPEATACLPTNRAEALTLLRKVDFDLAQLSPEEIAAIRDLFHLPGRGSANSGGQHGEE